MKRTFLEVVMEITIKEVILSFQQGARRCLLERVKDELVLKDLALNDVAEALGMKRNSLGKFNGILDRELLPERMSI